jgi:hypothetical protein
MSVHVSCDLEIDVLEELGHDHSRFLLGGCKWEDALVGNHRVILHVDVRIPSHFGRESYIVPILQVVIQEMLASRVQQRIYEKLGHQKLTHLRLHLLHHGLIGARPGRIRRGIALQDLELYCIDLSRCKFPREGEGLADGRAEPGVTRDLVEAIAESVGDIEVLLRAGNKRDVPATDLPVVGPDGLDEFEIEVSHVRVVEIEVEDACSEEKGGGIGTGYGDCGGRGLHLVGGLRTPVYDLSVHGLDGHARE